jgi:hypothetical protein
MLCKFSSTAFKEKEIAEIIKWRTEYEGRYPVQETVMSE